MFCVDHVLQMHAAGAAVSGVCAVVHPPFFGAVFPTLTSLETLDVRFVMDMQSPKHVPFLTRQVIMQTYSVLVTAQVPLLHGCALESRSSGYGAGVKSSNSRCRCQASQSQIRLRAAVCCGNVQRSICRNGSCRLAFCVCAENHWCEDAFGFERMQVRKRVQM